MLKINYKCLTHGYMSLFFRLLRVGCFYKRVTSKPRKQQTTRLNMKFLLHKDKEEKGKASPQKQECGCPSLQPSLRSHTHAFFADPLALSARNLVF